MYVVDLAILAGMLTSFSLSFSELSLVGLALDVHHSVL